MQLETGRPSAIEITDCDQPLPDQASGLNACFVRWVSLSLLVGKISEHIFQRRTESALDFLSRMAQLDQALVDWLDEGTDNAKSSEEKSFAVFLSLQFHQVSRVGETHDSRALTFPPGPNHSSTGLINISRGVVSQSSSEARF